MKKIFFDTNNQKVLKFLIENNKESKAASEIQPAIKISKGGLNFALRNLVKYKLVKQIVSGKTYFYQSIPEHPVIKQLKVLNSIIKLHSLIKKISPHTQKVILFGSMSRGENLPDSDVDFLILTHNKKEILKILKPFKKLLLKPIIKTPFEFENLKENDSIFYSEIIRGIILFEKDE